MIQPAIPWSMRSQTTLNGELWTWEPLQITGNFSKVLQN